MTDTPKDHRKHAVISVIAVVVIGILAWVGQSFVFNGEAAALRSVDRERGNVPIEAVFEESIVYTTDASHPKERLQDDCRDRGGSFNECGNREEGSPEDVLVCAYTCEF